MMTVSHAQSQRAGFPLQASQAPEPDTQPVPLPNRWIDKIAPPQEWPDPPKRPASPQTPEREREGEREGEKGGAVA